MENIIVKDIIIIGAGAAGLTAAIYGARSGLDTLVLENALVGGQMPLSGNIRNYPGFECVSGAELSERMQNQAEKAGALIDEFDNITEIKLADNEKIIKTKSNNYSAKAVIIAAGAVPKKLMVSGEEEFSGKGVHYCALCDGYAYKGKTTAVIGGGNSALEEALYLSKLASKVVILCRKDSFKGEKLILEAVEKTSNIEILYNTEATEFCGADKLEYITILDINSQQSKDIQADGAFIYIGRSPNNRFVKDCILLSESGYIIVDGNMQTNIKGVFAAGDICEKQFRQIVTAVSDGACAALSAEKYIKRMTVENI